MEILNSIQEEAVQPWMVHVSGSMELRCFIVNQTLLDLTHHGNIALEISMRVFLERCDRERKAYSECGGTTPGYPDWMKSKQAEDKGSWFHRHAVMHVVPRTLSQNKSSPCCLFLKYLVTAGGN